MDYQNKSNEELEKLVGQKDGDAICELAERFLHGTRGQSTNVTRAYKLFHKGEKMGLARAYAGIGEMYRTGAFVARNDDLAREYYQKAGIPYPGSAPVPPEPAPSPCPPEPTPIIHNVSGNGGTGASNYISDLTFSDKLNQAEQLRSKEEYMAAKQICGEICQLIQDCSSGYLTYSGSRELDEWLIDAYWIMAYISFNEKNYMDLDRYLAQEGVVALHPWGCYLQTVGHQMMQSSTVVLTSDLQNLLTVKDNPNMTQKERGDVHVMIGELISEGAGASIGLDPSQAAGYYQISASCGNEYAKSLI